MAVALAGARYGVEAVPKNWLHLEARDYVLELADRLYERVGE